MSSFKHGLGLTLLAAIVFHTTTILAAPQETDLRPFALDGNTGQHRTTVDLVGLSRCMFGDMDSLLLELRAAKGLLGMQMTIETVGVETGQSYYGNALAEKTSPENMGSYQLTLPGTLSPRLYGVFLCTIDEARAGHSPCSVQALKSSDELALPYRGDTGDAFSSSPKPKPTRTAAPQKFEPTIFYAQFFVVNSKGAALLTNTDSPTLTKSLQSFGFSKESLPGITSAIKRYTGSIDSLPLDYRDGRLQMQLPYYDQEKCMGTGN